MRDLNECRAEVFCRSRKRINKNRKIRNCVMLFCVALCLAVTAYSVSDFAFHKTEFIVEGEAYKSEVADDDISVGIDVTSAYIEFTGNNGKKEYYVMEKDAAEIVRILNIIECAFSADDNSQEQGCETSGDYSEGELSQVTDENMTTFDKTVYSRISVTFATKGGDSVSYTINENKLINESTCEEKKLFDDQYLKIVEDIEMTLEQEDK